MLLAGVFYGGGLLLALSALLVLPLMLAHGWGPLTYLRRTISRNRLARFSAAPGRPQLPPQTNPKPTNNQPRAHTMSEEKRFERRDAIGEGVKGALIMGGVGAIVSGVQNSLQKQNVGALGVLTRTGGTIAIFGTPMSAHALCGS
jgi:hypothetical protein